MYPIPANFDLSPLIDEEIGNITLGPYFIMFTFTNDWLIRCEGRVEMRNSEKEVLIHEETAQNLNEIKNVFLRKVTDWRKVSEHIFEIQFGSDYLLRFTDNTPQYESFEIETNLPEPKGWLI